MAEIGVTADSVKAKAENQWRTFSLALVLGLALLGAFWWGSGRPGDVVDRMFGNLCWTYLGSVGLLAGRSALKTASANGGLKGALGAMLGSTPQPEPPRAP